jgi:hypothetical protein
MTKTNQKTASKTAKLGFKPKQVVKHLMDALGERARDVIEKRYGLGEKTEHMTLESIGKKYSITRERVRQIENHALGVIRKSKEYQKEKGAFDELKDSIKSIGGIIAEEDLLDYFAKDGGSKNQVHFMLVVGEQFTREKEDDHFKHRWHVDKELADKIHASLKKLYNELNDDDLIADPDMIESFLEYVREVADEYKDDEVVKRWLSVSHRIGKNPLGEWGKIESPNIKAKGMRDYAFLVIRKHGSPIHFREVAKAITEYFNKKAHVATTHNELIKDDRFVLVGRGLYALKEWGYMSGVVKDVIKKIIEKNGPMVRDKIVEKVLKERYVKENTILVNLQNPKYFYKDKEGKYHNIDEKQK